MLVGLSPSGIAFRVAILKDRQRYWKNWDSLACPPGYLLAGSESGSLLKHGEWALISGKNKSQGYRINRGAFFQEAAVLEISSLQAVSCWVCE
jgi:hypothetical protein